MVDDSGGVVGVGGRDALRGARRVIVKVGSGVLTERVDGAVRLDVPRVHALAADIAGARGALDGRFVIVVSSGAVAAGLGVLGMSGRPDDLAGLQAAAAVGQPLLMRAWGEAFGAVGLRVGQMLVSRGGFDRRDRYVNTRACLRGLLAAGVVPIVNENDTVATEEISLGDNDLLAARLAVAVEADALLLLSQVEGVVGEDGAVVGSLGDADAVRGLAHDGSSSLGSGGMASKVSAIEVAGGGGAATVIAGGRAAGVVGRVLAGEALGTFVGAAGGGGRARKRWLEGAVTVSGRVVVDGGAVRALRERGASLLASGCVGVEGAFGRGDALAIVDRGGVEVARGLSNYASEELVRVLGKRSDEIAVILGARAYAEVVHRDNLVVRGGAGGLVAE